MNADLGHRGPDQAALDADLIAYYDAEARERRRTGHGDLRDRLRAGFADLLRAEGRLIVADIGAGPGIDTAWWQAEGFRTVGLDLAHANARRMGEQRLRAVTGSLYRLPFRAGAFDALWTMSTFVHVPHDRFDAAIGEMVRVVRPGGLLGIGTWGGLDFEGVPAFGDLRPHRFFSLAAHERWQAMLARHADVEVFDAFDPQPPHGWAYQFAVLRVPTTEGFTV